MMPKVCTAFADMSAEEKAALPVDTVTGKRIVAQAARQGVTWLAFDDGTETIRGGNGKKTEWPE